MSGAASSGGPWLVVGLACVVGVTTACTTASTASTSDAAAGSGAANGEGIGDPYYPDDGNLGYDVAGYHVRLTYQPDRQSIAARTTIRATAAKRLTSFHLDLLGLTVDQVSVDGARGDLRAPRRARARHHAAAADR